MYGSALAEKSSFEMLELSFSFPCSFNSISCRGCSVLPGVNPNETISLRANLNQRKMPCATCKIVFVVMFLRMNFR